MPRSRSIVSISRCADQALCLGRILRSRAGRGIDWLGPCMDNDVCEVASLQPPHSYNDSPDANPLS
jgi:hypothetical protein